VVALSFTAEKRKNTICSHIQVHIKDSLTDQFVTETEVTDFIHGLDEKVLGQPIKSINIQELEKSLIQKPDIKNTEVYFTASGDMNIDIDQRNPILRIVNKKGQSYYVDKEGFIMPLKSNYTSHVLIANGEILEFFELAKTNWLNCRNPNLNNKNYDICEIFELAKFINNNPFWKAQVEQIYLNEEGEYELIPRVGAHIIKFGEFENYREKFRNLKVFYKKGLNNVGWNQYLVINLKYDNQIICTKK
jgi:cell division protein FtsQ